MKIDLNEREIEYLIRIINNNYGEKELDFDKDITSRGIGNSLVGKLICSSNDKNYRLYEAAREHLTQDNQINKKLFMGTGWHSRILCNLLHKRLSFAFSELSAKQQNGGMGYEFDHDMNKKCEESIKNVIKDIMFAFDLSVKDF
jgi:hypothetical protein